MAYESILRLRPTNVMHQLEPKCPLPLLSGRSCVSALATSLVTLWVPAVDHPIALKAIVRAAAHLKAVIGLGLAPTGADTFELKRFANPAVFFRTVLTAAAELNFQVAPFFLHVQEPPVGRMETPAFEAMSKHIIASLDCGFTSFGVDLSNCPETELIPALHALFDPIVERELALVVRLPRSVGRGIERTALFEQTIQKMAMAGIRPDLVLIAERSMNDRAHQVHQLALAIAPTGIACDDSASAYATGSLPSVGVRAVVGDSRLAALVDRYELDPERLEALVYLEAVDRIEKLRGRGSADRLVAHLAGSALS